VAKQAGIGLAKSRRRSCIAVAGDGHTPPSFVPTGQPEISQTRGVWFTAQNEIRPEGTVESIVL